MHVLRGLYLTGRFFLVFAGLVAVMAFSFFWSFLFPVGQALLLLFVALTLMEVFVLFWQKKPLTAERKLPELFSLNDPNKVTLTLESFFFLKLRLLIIDEIPVQFQERHFRLYVSVLPHKKEIIHYELVPKTRGEYHFGNINIFIYSNVGLIQRRIKAKTHQMVPVYPSVIQMKQYELLALARISTLQGIKKIRRIGHSYEFEQIKNYVPGDDYRSINWKATGRRGDLMVNQYEDERSQQVYALIDKGRSMKMPFHGLSLLDYSINTSLVILNVALQKHDRAGLLTFSDKIGQSLKADNRRTQLKKILETLYRQQERANESNFELLFQATKTLIRGRSLLFLFTNFESYYAMERVLPMLRYINNMHVLVVVFFENTEIADFKNKPAATTEDIYFQTIAEKFVLEKEQIAQRLRQHGIQTILTRPEDLSINTVNKYLELKARGLI